MKKVKFYSLGKNIINVAPRMILVNGTPVAHTYKEFIKWIISNEISVERFVNWPFMTGISTNIETHKIDL